MACAHDTFEAQVLVSPAVQPAHYRVVLRVRCQACQEALHFALPVLPPMVGVTPIVAMSSNGQEALLAAHLAPPVVAPEAAAPWQAAMTLADADVAPGPEA
jgi:prepilin signal peptidase PulO-like enzyme (type II secretory pathway)